MRHQTTPGGFCEAISLRATSAHARIPLRPGGNPSDPNEPEYFISCLPKTCYEKSPNTKKSPAKIPECLRRQRRETGGELTNCRQLSRVATFNFFASDNVYH